MIVIRGVDKNMVERLRDVLSTHKGATVEYVDPKPISNQTCRLCKKKGECYPYKFFGYILCTDSKFSESKDHDDFFLHLGELCKKHEFIEGQEG